MSQKGTAAELGTERNWKTIDAIRHSGQLLP